MVFISQIHEQQVFLHIELEISYQTLSITKLPMTGVYSPLALVHTIIEP